MKATIKYNTENEIRYIDIELSNGTTFRVEEKFEELSIMKTNFGEGISILPKVSNVIGLK